MESNMDQILNNESNIQETNVHILNTKFDKIYVIHCVENTKRYNNIIFQQEKTNLDFDIWWTTKSHPFSDQMLNGVLLSGYGRYVINKSELNLTREFYSIIKIAYDRGFNNILIFEDDFSLMKNEYIKDFIENIPEDFDLIQFSILANKELFDYSNLINKYENNILFTESDNGFWSNNGLALSRKGMKYFIDYVNNEFVAADIPAFEFNNTNKFYGKTYIKDKYKNLKSYVTTVPLVFLDIRFDSAVQQREKRELYETYENLNKNFYNIMQDEKKQNN